MKTEIRFDQLVNSIDRSQLPPGTAFESINAAADSRTVRLMPRYGDVWSRSGAHANDSGLGFCHAEYSGSEEYLAVLQLNGESFSRLYTVNPSTGVFAQVTNGGGSPDPQNLASGGTWFFEQHGGTVYMVHDGTSTQMYKHAVGVNGSATAFETFTPTYNRGAGFGAVVDTDYPSVAIASAELFDVSTLGSMSIDQVSPAGFRLNVSGAIAGPGTIILVVSVPEGLDVSLGDLYHFKFDKSANVNSTLTTSIAVSTDPDATVSSAWAQALRYCTADDLENTSGTFYDGVFDLGAILPARTGRDAVYWIAIKITSFDTSGAGTLALSQIRQGGFTTWDVASVSSIGYAVRWANLKGSTPRYTSLVRMPDVLVADMIGESVHANMPEMGSRVTVSVPYFAKRANEGYDFVQVRRQDSASSGDWYQVGQMGHRSPGPNSLLDTTLQSEVNAGATAATPGESGPPADCEVIGLWRQHLVLGSSKLAFMSFGNLPGEFRPAAGELSGAYDTLDDDLARTFYVNRGRTQDAMAFVDSGELFIGTSRETMYMAGDTADSLSPPRPLPGGRGLTGQRGMCAYAGGCLVAHTDGLWYYRVLGAPLVSGDVQVERIELTKDVRDSWSYLLAGGSGANIVVCTMEEEVWCFNTQGSNKRVLRRTRPVPVSESPSWQPGTWTHQVHAAVYAPGRGLRTLLANGTIARVGFDANGAAYTSDAGTAVSWERTTGDFCSDREEVTEIEIEGDGSVALRLSVDDADGAGFTNYDFVRQSGHPSIPTLDCKPGFRHRYKVSGDSGAVLRRLYVRTEERM